MFIMDNSDLTVVQEYSTKNHNLLLQTRYNFTFLQQNVEYSCKMTYNLLPTEVRVTQKIKLRKWLKLYLVETAFYRVGEFFDSFKTISLEQVRITIPLYLYL